MKSAILLALGMSLIGDVTFSSAANAAEKPGKEARQAERLKNYDTDKNGKLSKAEKESMKEDLKKKKDARKENKKGTEPTPGEKK